MVEAVTIIASISSAVITAIVAFLIQEKKFRRDFKHDIGKMRTEYQAEEVVKMFLEDPRWEQRSFSQIKHHVGGFEDNELRQILVRAGALRFGKSGEERWGLISRNKEHLRLDGSD